MKSDCLRWPTGHWPLRYMSLVSHVHIVIYIELIVNFFPLVKSPKTKSTLDILVANDSGSNNFKAADDKDKVLLWNCINLFLQLKMKIFRLYMWLTAVWSIELYDGDVRKNLSYIRTGLVMALCS